MIRFAALADKSLFSSCTYQYLALVGIEGKMFKPMAQTVSFAILGAFILSLTYVPMISALFLSKNSFHKHISDKFMDFFKNLSAII